jgi:TPR repeat protein
MGSLARTWYDESSRSLSSAAEDDLKSLAEELLASTAAAGIVIAHEQGDSAGALVCIISVGDCVPHVGAELDPNSGISGRCVRECRLQRSHDTSLDPRVERGACERLGIRSLVAAPLVVNSRCMGLIEAVSDRPGHFDSEKIIALEQAARSAALLLGGEERASEQQVIVIPIAAAEATEEAAPSLDAADDQSPAIGAAEEQDEALPAQEEITDPEPHAAVSRDSAQLPKFLELESPRPDRRWLLWVAVVSLTLAAALASAQLLRSRLRVRPAPSQHPEDTASASAAQTSQDDFLAGKTEEHKTDESHAGLVTNDGNSAALSLADRAQRGDVLAQVKLAQAYFDGDGVPQDKAKAVSWFIMAAEHGSIAARLRSVELTRGMAPFQVGEIRFDVGKMYMNGVGAPRDDVSAYAWFELAKKAGDIRAAQEEAALEQNMQPGQVKEARARAAQWLSSHFRKRRR